MNEQTAISVAITVAIAWLGHMEFRLRTAISQLGTRPDRDEVHMIVGHRQEALVVMQKQLKEDVTMVRRDLAEIKNLLIAGKKK